MNDTISLTNIGSRLRLQAPAVELEWDLARGGILVFCRDQRSGVTFLDPRESGPAPDIIVSVSKTLGEQARDLRLSEMGMASAELFLSPDCTLARVELATRGPEVGVFRTITVRAHSAWVEEKVSIQNLGGQDLLIDRYPEWDQIGGSVAGDLFDYRVRPGGIEYELRGLRTGNDWSGDEYVTPASAYPFFHNRGRFADMNDVGINLTAGHHGAVMPCVMAFNEARQAGLLLSVMNERALRYVHMAGDSASRTGALTARVWWARWLAPGERQEAATFHLVPFQGDYGAMLCEYRDWLVDECGLESPADAPAVLDNLFIGNLPSPMVRSLGHFDQLRPYIEYMKRVGCTAVFEHGNWLDAADTVEGALLSRCQPITQEGRYATTTRFGGEAAHRELRDYIHALDMKYMVWFTGYGLTSFDAMFREHREMFITLRKSAGCTMQTHSEWPGFDFALGWADDWAYHPFGGPTVGADTTHRRWREFWLGNQEYWSRNGVDGCFFDSFNPMPPNYALRPWPGQIGREIINLQREARRLARANNPDYVTYTEGGGCEMSTVNDLTHTWHGCTPPPLPPFRETPLTPEEEARFLRDEVFSMLPGTRSWRILADDGLRCEQRDLAETRPRLLFSMFSNTIPVLPLFTRDLNDRQFVTQTEFYQEFQARPVEQLDPRDVELWNYVGRLWRLRQTHPELKSTATGPEPVAVDNPAVFAYLRRHVGQVTLVAVNFRHEPVECAVSATPEATGLDPNLALMPHDLLRDAALTPCTAAGLANGYHLTIPPRDAVVVKLTQSDT